MSTRSEGWGDWEKCKKTNEYSRYRTYKRNGKVIYYQWESETGPISDTNNQWLTKKESDSIPRTLLPSLTVPPKDGSRHSISTARSLPSHRPSPSTNPTAFGTYLPSANASSSKASGDGKKERSYEVKSLPTQDYGRHSASRLSHLNEQPSTSRVGESSRNPESRPSVAQPASVRPNADENLEPARDANRENWPPGTQYVRYTAHEIIYLNRHHEEIGRAPLGRGTNLPGVEEDARIESIGYPRRSSRVNIVSTTSGMPENETTQGSSSSAIPGIDNPRHGPQPNPGDSLPHRPPRRPSTNPQTLNPVPEDLAIDIRHIRSDKKGDEEKLDKRYYVHDHKFYCVGRVFAMLWHENDTKTQNGTVLTYDPKKYPLRYHGKYNEPIYTSVRRMVVVQQQFAHAVCVSIVTHQQQGCLKDGLSPFDIVHHAAIYMAGTDPMIYKGEREKGMIKDPIEVKPADKRQKLHGTSRIVFNKPYSVEYNVKSMNVGLVKEDDIAELIGNYKNGVLQGLSRSQPTPRADAYSRR